MKDFENLIIFKLLVFSDINIKPQTSISFSMLSSFLGITKSSTTIFFISFLSFSSLFSFSSFNLSKSFPYTSFMNSNSEKIN